MGMRERDLVPMVSSLSFDPKQKQQFAAENFPDDREWKKTLEKKETNLYFLKQSRPKWIRNMHAKVSL